MDRCDKNKSPNADSLYFVLILKYSKLNIEFFFLKKLKNLSFRINKYFKLFIKLILRIYLDKQKTLCYIIIFVLHLFVNILFLSFC